MDGIKQLSLVVGTGGASQKLTTSTTSGQSAALVGPSAVVYSTVDCFIRRGSNPTATNDGTDLFVPANTLLRIEGYAVGEKLAVKNATASGTFYITEGA